MPGPADIACDEIASRQYGVLSRRQAIQAGLSRRAVAARAARGQWLVIHPGVYRVRAVPSTWEGALMAAVLWAGHDAMVSHRAAAHLLGLDGIADPPVEISARIGRTRPGVVVHRLRAVDQPRSRLIRGFRVTVPERTLLDLAGVVSLSRAGRALDDALRRRLTTMARLRETLQVQGRSGRTGTDGLRRLLSVRDALDERMESALETRFLRLLRRSGLPVPIPQYEVTSRGKFVARLDFAYPELRLAIETHGYRHHGGYDRWRSDARRENRLKRLGWLVLVFTWDDVVGDAHRVVTEITEAFVQRSSKQLRSG